MEFDRFLEEAIHEKYQRLWAKLCTDTKMTHSLMLNDLMLRSQTLKAE